MPLIHALRDFASAWRERDALIVVHVDIGILAQEFCRMAYARLRDGEAIGDVYGARAPAFLLLNEYLLEVVLNRLVNLHAGTSDLCFYATPLNFEFQVLS